MSCVELWICVSVLCAFQLVCYKPKEDEPKFFFIPSFVRWFLCFSVLPFLCVCGSQVRVVSKWTHEPYFSCFSKAIFPLHSFLSLITIEYGRHNYDSFLIHVFLFFLFFLFRLWRWTRSVSTWRQLRAFHSRWEKTAIKNINKPSIVSSSSSRLSKKIVVVPSFLLLPQSLPQKKNVQIELWMWLLPHLLLLLLLLLSRRETDDGCCFFFFFFSVAAALRACFALFRLSVFCCYRAHSFFFFCYDLCL